MFGRTFLSRCSAHTTSRFSSLHRIATPPSTLATSNRLSASASASSSSSSSSSSPWQFHPKRQMALLYGIPPVLPPELLYTIASMGHGDQIVIADANFPAASTAAALPTSQSFRSGGGGLITMSGHSGTDVLRAILQLFPLDAYVDAPVAVMNRTASDEVRNLPVPIWSEYQAIVNSSPSGQTLINSLGSQVALSPEPVDPTNADTAGAGPHVRIEKVERFEFYQRAKQCYCVVGTGETALYANIILTKGVIAPL